MSYRRCPSTIIKSMSYFVVTMSRSFSRYQNICRSSTLVSFVTQTQNHKHFMIQSFVLTYRTSLFSYKLEYWILSLKHFFIYPSFSMSVVILIILFEVFNLECFKWFASDHSFSFFVYSQGLRLMIYFETILHFCEFIYLSYLPKIIQFW